MGSEDTNLTREQSQTSNRIILRSEGDSIVLQQLIPDDAEGYFQLVDSDRAHLSQFGDVTAEKYPTVEVVRESIVHPANPNKYRFGIWDGQIMVGTINLTPSENNRAEAGTWIAKAHTGHQYAARAGRLLIDFAFIQLHLDEVFAKIVVGNEASRKSAERSGFILNGEIEEEESKKWLYVLRNPRNKAK